MDLYRAQSYLEFLKSQLNENVGQKGYQSRLADAAGCQKSYFSRVLKGEVNLNAEQAMRLTQFWQLRELDADYFVELVRLARTTFPPLIRRIKARLGELKAKSHELTTRIAEPAVLKLQECIDYYSSWHFAAVHILTAIPRFRNARAIAAALELPIEVVLQILSKLQSYGLVTHSGQCWTITSEHMHLPSHSVMTSINHNNWRQRAVLESQRRNPDNLHYTIVQTHSSQDFDLLRSLALQMIERSREIMKESLDEEATCFSLDLFRIV